MKRTIDFYNKLQDQENKGEYDSSLKRSKRRVGKLKKGFKKLLKGSKKNQEHEKIKGDRVSNDVHKNQRTERKWMVKNSQTITEIYDMLLNDPEQQLALIEAHDQLERKSLNFYSSYNNGRERNKNKDPEDGADERLKKIAQSSDCKIPDKVQDYLNGIEDMVVKRLVEKDLQLFLRGLPEAVTEIPKLKENLSLWNELIERIEARLIAFLSFTNLIELDLSVMASVHHEAKNTEVSSLRRILKKMADKFALFYARIQLLKGQGTVKDPDRALLNLTRRLTAFYSKDENKMYALKSKIAALQTRHRRKKLIKTGRLLAISKTPSTILFLAGLVMEFIPGLQVPGLIVLGIAIGLKIPSIILQLRIGLDRLPKVDYNAEHAGKYNEKEIKNLESHIGFTLSDIRKGDNDIDITDFACDDPLCDIEHLEKTNAKTPLIAKNNDGILESQDSKSSTIGSAKLAAITEVESNKKTKESTKLGSSTRKSNFIVQEEGVASENELPLEPSPGMGAVTFNAKDPNSTGFLVFLAVPPLETANKSGNAKAEVESLKNPVLTMEGTIPKEGKPLTRKAKSPHTKLVKPETPDHALEDAPISAFSNKLKELKTHLEGKKKSDPVLGMLNFIDFAVICNWNWDQVQEKLISAQRPEGLGVKEVRYLNRKLAENNLENLGTAVHRDAPHIERKKKKKNKNKKTLHRV